MSTRIFNRKNKSGQGTAAQSGSDPAGDSLDTYLFYIEFDTDVS